MVFDRTQQTKPRKIFTPQQRQCYKCSMPGMYHCEHPNCGLPMCLKHRVRKAGGNLCERHRGAVLIQESAEPQSRFKDPGAAVPHED